MTRAAAVKESNSPGKWRVSSITVLMLLGWLAMIGRLIHVQGTQHASMYSRVDRQSTFTETLRARPGEIVDRNGHVLAMTVTRNRKM